MTLYPSIHLNKTHKIIKNLPRNYLPFKEALYTLNALFSYEKLNFSFCFFLSIFLSKTCFYKIFMIRPRNHELDPEPQEGILKC
jgi:hypothetical protein